MQSDFLFQQFSIVVAAFQDAHLMNGYLIQFHKPTTLREGEGVKEYTCLNCGHITDLKYVIPVVVAPIIFGGGW